MRTINRFFGVTQTILKYSKMIVVFVMLIYSMALSKFNAFLAYFISYQFASLLRLVLYIGLYNPIEPALTDLYYFPDMLDISTWIMLAKNGTATLPYQLYAPIFSISFAGAFITLGDLKNPSVPAQVTYTIVYAILALYIISIYISIPIYDAVPFVELVVGGGLGALFSYVIPFIYRSASYTTPKKQSGHPIPPPADATIVTPTVTPTDAPK